MVRTPKLPSVVDAHITPGMYVLVRASLNVPLVNGLVENDYRLQQALSTIKLLQERGARVLVMGHIGREPELSLRPVSEALQTDVPHTFVPALVGSAVAAVRANLKDGEVLLLENTRSHPGEKTNDQELAKELAQLAEYFVLDAFPVAHRQHASIVGVSQYLPTFAGSVFAQEYQELTKALKPQSPSLFMIGGAKFDTKLPLIEKYLELYDQVFVAGALANDLFKATGLEVGTSLVSEVDLTGHPMLEKYNLLLPIDVVTKVGDMTRVTIPSDVRRDEAILDIGPRTVSMLRNHITAAQTILWNGPFGNYEGGFAEGTEAVAELVAEAPGYSVVGGGDTVAAIENLHLKDTFNFLSTAGGAMLQYLEHGTLPGIEAILKAPSVKVV